MLSKGPGPRLRPQLSHRHRYRGTCLPHPTPQLTAQRRGLGTDSKMAPEKTSFFTGWIRKQVAHKPRFSAFPPQPEFSPGLQKRQTQNTTNKQNGERRWSFLACCENNPKGISPSPRVRDAQPQPQTVMCPWEATTSFERGLESGLCGILC